MFTRRLGMLAVLSILVAGGSQVHAADLNSLARKIENEVCVVLKFLEKHKGTSGFGHEEDALLSLTHETHMDISRFLLLQTNFLENKVEMDSLVDRMEKADRKVGKRIYQSPLSESVWSHWENAHDALSDLFLVYDHDVERLFNPDGKRRFIPFYYQPKPGNRTWGARGYGPP